MAYSRNLLFANIFSNKNSRYSRNLFVLENFPVYSMFAPSDFRSFESLNSKYYVEKNDAFASFQFISQASGAARIF